MQEIWKKYMKDLGRNSEEIVKLKGQKKPRKEYKKVGRNWAESVKECMDQISVIGKVM